MINQDNINNYHHTKTKGDFGTIMVIADLHKKGYSIFTPLSEHLPIDLIAYKEGKCFRIQCKYSSTNQAQSKTSWADKNGSHYKFYSETDFDYYALYLPEKNVICYPSIKFAGCKIRTDVPNSKVPFYWYEDFLDFTDEAEKKSYKEFGTTITYSSLRTRKGVPREKTRKVQRPSKEELNKLIWEKPASSIAKDFGVSDKAIEKWTKFYGLEKPGRGYWTKLKADK